VGNGTEGRLALLIAFLVASFNLRLGIASPGPLIDEIRLDTGMSSGVAGILITIPFICMSVFAFAGPPLIRRAASYGVVLFSLAMIALGTLARAGAPTPITLIAATIPIGLGIALAGVALPVVVKQHFVTRSGAVTGGYVAATSLGVLVIGLGIVPLADAVGGWRPAFAITAVPAFLAIALWVVVHNRETVAQPDPEPPEDLDAAIPSRLPDRDDLLAGLSFGLQSVGFGSMVGWSAAIYVDAGWSDAAAALTVASIGLFVIPGGLLFPSISQGQDRRPWIAGTVVLMSVGVLGVALAPTAAWWLWLPAFGIGAGGTFALQLALPIDVRASAAGVARLTAWMLGLGYLLTAFAPILVGALRDVTGGFEIPMTLIGAAALCGAAVAFMLPAPLWRAARPAAPEALP
jgi:CP family cyanate transporter-like MFS transporter